MRRSLAVVGVLPCLIVLLVRAGSPQTVEWLGPHASQSNPEFQTRTAEAETPWLTFREQAGIVYFVFQDSPRVERYSIADKMWLPVVDLAEAPTAFYADSDGFYVSFGRRTSRFSLDWQEETHLRNTNHEVVGIATRDDFVYLQSTEELVSANKWNGALVDWQTYFYRLRSLALAPDMDRLFGRTAGVSPSDIVQVHLNPDGTFGGQDDSPYHGDFPDANKVYVFPNQALVADDSGIVYHSLDLTYANSLAGPFQGLSFFGDLPIVLREGTLVAYSASFLRTGQYSPAAEPLGILVYEEMVLGFSYEQGAIQVSETPVSLLNPEDPGLPVDPNGLLYDPDTVVLGPGNVLYLLSRLNLSIFRWSIERGAYLKAIPLALAPRFMALSHENNALYLAYSSGEITRISLSSLLGFVEEPFVNSPQTPCGLATAGEYIFVCDPSGAWVSHFTYGADGLLISQQEWNYRSDEYVWSPANRKMYHLRDDTIPNDLLWEELDEQGMIGAQMDSPYHSSDGIAHPIRVADDGSRVLLGSGRIYDGVTLDQRDTLGNDIDDAVWVGGEIYSLRRFGSWSQIQRWSPPNWGVTAVRELEGAPIRLFFVGDEIVVLSSRGGKPWFSRWNLDLEGLGPSVLKDDGLVYVEAGQWIDYSIFISNLEPDAVDIVVVDELPAALQEVSWTCSSTAGSACGNGDGDILDEARLLPQGSLVYSVRARVPIDVRTQLSNRVTVDRDGEIYSDTDLTQVNAAEHLIFSDDLESGDTSAWSEVAGNR